MSQQRKRIENKMEQVGAAWAVTSKKTILPEDGFGAWPRYHVHPDASYPHQSAIMQFDTLAEVEKYLDTAILAKGKTHDEAMQIWEEYNDRLLLA